MEVGRGKELFGSLRRLENRRDPRAFIILMCVCCMCYMCVYICMCVGGNGRTGMIIAGMVKNIGVHGNQKQSYIVHIYKHTKIPQMFSFPIRSSTKQYVCMYVCITTFTSLSLFIIDVQIPSHGCGE